MEERREDRVDHSFIGRKVTMGKGEKMREELERRIEEGGGRREERGAR